MAMSKEELVIYHKNYRITHKKEMKEYRDKYNLSHADQVRAYYRNYYRINNLAEKRREYGRNYRKTHPKKRAKRSPEYVKIRNLKRRSRLYGAEGAGITKIDWANVLNKYEGKCLSCGTKEDITLDHIVPLSKKGTHSIENIQPLCRRCNATKGTKTIDYRL